MSPPAVSVDGASMLELRDITAGYGAFTALWNVGLRVQAGEAVAVVGPNGAGKTTLLRVISGMIPIRSGELFFEGASLGGRPGTGGIVLVASGRRGDPRGVEDVVGRSPLTSGSVVRCGRRG